MAQNNGFFRVLFRRRNNVIGIFENSIIAVFHAVYFPACHRVGGDKLHIRAEHLLNIIDYAALHAGHICQNSAGLQILLILLQPAKQHLGVEGKHHDVRFADHLRVDLSRALGDHAVLQSVGDGRRASGDGAYPIALFVRALA